MSKMNGNYENNASEFRYELKIPVSRLNKTCQIR
jgi:hypothetical protein